MAEEQPVDEQPQENAAAEEAPAEEAAAAEEAPAGGGLVGKLKDIAAKLIRWHPYIFMGVALLLAAYAWWIYPEPEATQVPPAADFYNEGLDRLYRVLNPDLPLLAQSPADEALVARSAFMNLFVFHRPDLRLYPEFINPHLLLGEANRLLAEFNPAMADKYNTDAQAAYRDAELWEVREDTASNLARYVNANFLDRRHDIPDDGTQFAEIGFFEANNDEITLRRTRRLEYIRFRLAEADIALRHPDLARTALEEIRRLSDSRRRDSVRQRILGEGDGDDAPRRPFELGPEEYQLLDLLLGQVYDDLALPEMAKACYLRFLANVQGGRRHVFVAGRLAALNQAEGELYHRVDPARAETGYLAAIGYYEDINNAPSADRTQRSAALLGLADIYSRLADLVVAGERTGIDDLSEIGRTLREWLEDFSGQILPRRTLAIPLAIGTALSRPQYFVPDELTIPAAVGGTLMAMASGRQTTPNELSRMRRSRAMEYYDQVAADRAGTEDGDRAVVRAAWECWLLGRKDEAEDRFERMMDPLAKPDLNLAARMGLATIALDKNDLDRAHMLLMGGYAHIRPLWFVEGDADWRIIASRLGTASTRTPDSPWLRVWQTIPEEGADIAAYAASGRRLSDEYVGRFLRALNTMLRRPDFYDSAFFPAAGHNAYLTWLLGQQQDMLTQDEVVWRNRMLLEEAWLYELVQKGVRDNVEYPPFPTGRELTPGGLLEESRMRDILTQLAQAWAESANSTLDPVERRRRLGRSNQVFETALNSYHGEPGEILYDIAHNYESLAEIRESEGSHMDALLYTAAAARSYLDVSFKAQGSPREMDALLEAGDAFFRAGLLERTIESQRRFLERFGYATIPGTESAMNVVRAENLLGRAYWFLGDAQNAIASFGRNLARRTPDRYKSVYYIGRVLMEEGMIRNQPQLLGTAQEALPALDRNGDPVITSALQAFTWLRQSPDANPEARAWRWATFDLATLTYTFAERVRREWEAQQASAAEGENAASPATWIAQYDEARAALTEALDRYPLTRNGAPGISIRVEPEDYADCMGARFAAEYMLANTLLVLGEARQDPALSALARTHLSNIIDGSRYANALFDTSLDRFQLNGAVIREEVEGGQWDRAQPLPRTRLGDDEGPTHSPWRNREMLRNATQLLAGEYFRAGDAAARREGGAAEAAGYYRLAYETYQALYDRFGMMYGSMAMLGMGDSLARLGRDEDAANHYRMARNIAEIMPADTRSDGLLDIGPSFWGERAADRLTDRQAGFGNLRQP